MIALISKHHFKIFGLQHISGYAICSLFSPIPHLASTEENIDIPKHNY
ncbi:hypothetical protein ASZ90_011855 [hydrocarbon metagenome]|uniref:Uncharacterized protein n=1 Tax=hydrocarbon metagenome TaxID=938273 RepID=A0A0W8FC41_9ZZZZ